MRQAICTLKYFVHPFALTLLLSTVGACGGQSSADSSPYLEKCQVQCRTSAFIECRNADLDRCARDCSIVLQGLPSLCAQCLLEGMVYRSISGECQLEQNNSTTSSTCKASCMSPTFRSEVQQ